MTKSTTNNAANISTGKGLKGGYAFAAPLGTTLPEDYSSALDTAFEPVGYVSSDGITFTTDEDNDSINDMNGESVNTSFSGRVDEEQFTPLENKALVQKILYGIDNTTDENGIISTKHNSNAHAEYAYVFELVLKDNRRWRVVVPDGQTLSIDDLQVDSSDAAARQVTIKNLPDASGNTYYDYMQSTETAANA